MKRHTGRLILACVLLPVLSPAAQNSDAARTGNREIITRFADLFYRQRKVDEAFSTYVAPDYIQHNPGLADGREAAIVALRPLFARQDHSFAIERILVDGDLAAIHVRVTSPTPPGTKGAAVVDLYRLVGGKIVEHWDVIQLVPEKSANAHPMF
jgi:predicted SnoaL-like aldol condensation-catalyzing enzyme